MSRLWRWASVVMIIAIALSPSVAALHFSDYSISFKPINNGVRENISLTVTPEEDTNSISYQLENIPSSVYASSGPDSTFEVQGNAIIIRDEFEAGEEKKINMAFNTYTLTEKVGDTTIFSSKFTPPEMLESLDVKFFLGEDHLISDIEPAVSPSANLETNGRDITVTWQFTEVNESINFILLYKERNSGIPTWVFVVSGIILLGCFGFLLFKNKEKKKAMVGTLSQKEKTIINLLKDNPKLTQKELVKETGFSKAKMSKTIRNLEKKGVLRKEPYMNTNKLFLKGEFRGN